jgi:hypothetical protein
MGHSPVSVKTNHFDHDEEDDYEDFIGEGHELLSINEAIEQSFCDTHNYLKFLGSCARDAWCNGGLPDLRLLEPKNEELYHNIEQE